jgi:hypothetical protein
MNLKRAEEPPKDAAHACVSRVAATPGERCAAPQMMRIMRLLLKLKIE